MRRLELWRKGTFGALLLGSVLLSLCLTFIGTSSAKALTDGASPRIAEELKINRPNNSGTCTDVEVTTSYMGDAIQYFNSHGQSDKANKISDAIDPDNYYWAVFQETATNGAFKQIRFVALKKNSTSGYYSFGTGASMGNRYNAEGVYFPVNFDNYVPETTHLGFTLDLDSSCNKRANFVDGGFQLGVSSISENTNAGFGYFVNTVFPPTDPSTTLEIGIFLINMPFQAPTGYTGEEPDTGFQTKTTVKPEFTYDVLNKSVSARDIATDLPTYTPTDGWSFEGFTIEWTLYHCKDGFEPVGSICNGSEIAKYQQTKQTDEFKFEVGEYGDYTLEAQYLAVECYRYPSYPATPDYCVTIDYGQAAQFEDYDFVPTTVYLEINGQSITGDTRDAECDVSGFCEAPSPYEDCGTYGTDLIGGLGCQFRNFGVFMGIMLRNLFVPPASFFQEYWNRFNSFMNTKLGFLYQSITSLVGIVTAMISNVGSANCVLQTPGEIWGAPFRLNGCALNEISPVIWTGVSTLLRGAVVIGFVYAFHRKYVQVMEAR